jgi:hypothetical protein
MRGSFGILTHGGKGEWLAEIATGPPNNRYDKAPNAECNVGGTVHHKFLLTFFFGFK